jgi:hypothetical protein
MSKDAAVQRHWTHRLGGLGLFVGLVAFPHATAWLLIIRLINWSAYAHWAPMLVAILAFTTAIVLTELTLGRRYPLLSFPGGPTCIDARLSAGEKLARLKSDPQFALYLGSQLVLVCALSLALALLR